MNEIPDDLSRELDCEFGSNFPVRFLNPNNVKMFDDEGNEIEFPICDKCKSFKTELIGKEVSRWICEVCHERNPQ